MSLLARWLAVRGESIARLADCAEGRSCPTGVGIWHLRVLEMILFVPFALG